MAWWQRQRQRREYWLIGCGEEVAANDMILNDSYDDYNNINNDNDSNDNNDNEERID